LSVIKEHRAG